MQSHLVTPQTFTKAYNALCKADVLTVDCETNGVNPYAGDTLCGVAICAEGDGYYFPFRHGGGRNLDATEAMPALARLLTKVGTIQGHNYKFDIAFLHKDGVPLPSKIFDTMLAAHVLNENEESLSLKNLGVKYLRQNADHENKALQNQLALWGYKKDEMWRFPPEMVTAYACEDVFLTRELAASQRAKLKKVGLETIADEVSYFGLQAAEMESRGLHIDRELCQDYQIESLQNAGRLQQKLTAMVGRAINPNSPKQIMRWLGTSSSKSATLLEVQASGHYVDEIQALLDCRAWIKSNSTYYKAFLSQADASDRIHCNLRIHGTVTSRISCSKPNLQAIPRQTDIYKVKNVFTTEPGWLFAEADYSQAEMRVAVHYSRDARMEAMIRKGVDLHSTTAKSLGIPRDVAKTINFGVIYGMGATALSEQLGIAEHKAKSYLDKYHGFYPSFRVLARRAERQAKSRGFIKYWTGRRRHFNTDNAYTHKAIANLVQGSCGEMVRVAMRDIRETLPAAEIQILMQVHDSIIFRIRETSLHLLKEVKTIMETQPWCRLPQHVDIKLGPSWGTATEQDI